MNYLLDTHVLLGIMKEDANRFPSPIREILAGPGLGLVSVVSLWEIAIKSRLGKLELPFVLENLPALLDGLKFDILYQQF
jgi:PIN domain nuclease of toxin-antitoxin system